MKAVFVESSLFEKSCSKYLSDEEYSRFQSDLLANPYKGNIIQGTGGLRKIRVGMKGKGKRGGGRIILFG